MKKIFKQEKGLALILVIVLLGVVGSLASSLLIMHSSNLDLADDSSSRAQAFYAAEGGVNFLDLKINEFYQENIEGKSFFNANDIREQLETMEGEIKNTTFKMNGYDISYDFYPHSDYEENSRYIYEITANNGKKTEIIKVEYEVAHLIDYFKFSRYANKINIKNSQFGGSIRNSWWWGYYYDPRFDVDRIDDNSFGTYETLYYNWSDSSIYNEGDYVVHNNLVYSAIEDYSAGEALEPGKDGWEDYWKVETRFKQWSSENEYKNGEKIIYENEIYISDKNNNSSEPVSGSDWTINDPDIAKQELANYENKARYDQPFLPTDDDYKKDLITEFESRLSDEGGYTYNDDPLVPHDYSDFNSSNDYSRGDIVSLDNEVYIITSDGPGYYENYEKITDKLSASEKFILDNKNYSDNYILIDGDFKPSQAFLSYFNEKDLSRNYNSDDEEVLHIMVNGEISPKADVTLKGDSNVILYTTADEVDYRDGHVLIGNKISLAYFAPFASFTSKSFTGGFASSMVFNEINIIDGQITTVKTYSDENALRGSMDPGIADLTRAYGDFDYDSDSIGPRRLSWNVE